MIRITQLLLVALSLVVISVPALAGSVTRGQFTTDIVDREPVDNVESIASDTQQIKYFTELADLQGHTITHQWVYNGEAVFDISFNVGGPRWRVWSSKSLPPGWTGTWTVNTIDEDGSTLLTQSLEYR